MKSKKGIFGVQVSRLLNRNEFKIAWVLSMLFVTAAFIESCIMVWGKDKSELFSAALGWIGNKNIFSGTVIYVFYFFAVSLIAALPFSDSFLKDKQSRSLCAILTRCEWGSYIKSGLFLTFISGFIVIFVPLLLSQALAFIVFSPTGDMPMKIWGTGAWDAAPVTDACVFPVLALNHPYLNNMIFIFYASLFAGLNAVISYVISLLGVSKKLFVLCLPTVLCIVYNGIISFASGSLRIDIYLFPDDLVSKNTLFFFLIPVVQLLIIAAGLIALRVKKTEAVL